MPASPSSLTIRSAMNTDDSRVWEILHAVVERGDSFAFDPALSREEGLAWWNQPHGHRYVAELDGRIVGAYIIKPNQPGPGSHVANASYMVAPESRGHRIGFQLGEHSLAEARRLGFRAMQFNLVVATNEPAVRLWKSLGFTILATLPGVFHHPQRGYVDAYVMLYTL
jgi:GNAT superfamily N-acetyltransferase